MSDRRRVVVTGPGAVTPLGNTVRETWEGMKAGRNGIGPITLFDTADYKAKLTAEDAKSLGIVERILSEPDMGKKEFYERIRTLLTEEFSELSADPDLIGKRYERFRRIGAEAVKESL